MTTKYPVSRADLRKEIEGMNARIAELTTALTAALREAHNTSLVNERAFEQYKELLMRYEEAERKLENRDKLIIIPKNF